MTYGQTRSIVARTILLAGILIAIWSVDWVWLIRGWWQFLEIFLPPPTQTYPLSGLKVGFAWMVLTPIAPVVALCIFMQVFGFIWEALGDRTPKRANHQLPKGLRYDNLRITNQYKRREEHNQ